MGDVEEPCQYEVTEYLKGHCEGSFVDTHAVVENKVELPWKLCSTQHRHIHKEDVAVEEEKVGTSSKLEPHKEPNVDVKDKGTSTIGIDEVPVEKYDVLEDEGRSTIEFFEATIEKATRKFAQIKREETRPHFLYLPKVVIEKTLGCATQYYRSIVSGPMIRSTYRHNRQGLILPRGGTSTVDDRICNNVLVIKSSIHIVVLVLAIILQIADVDTTLVSYITRLYIDRPRRDLPAYLAILS
jgi:hypothetical protein